MNNNYYTPDISEFFVGFEYEYYNDFSNKWVNRECDFEAFQDNEMGPIDEEYTVLGDYSKRIRVKYLDKEDIESLGFEWYKTHPGTVCMEFEKGEYELTYDPDWNGKKYLRIATDGEGDVTLFSGIIKNKSELIKLLKQLNIQ